MRGIEDPLLQWFMEESAAKEIHLQVLRADKRRLENEINDLMRVVARHQNETRQLLDWHHFAQDRFLTYQRLLRSQRDRCFELERRLLQYEPYFEVINLASDSDDDLETPSTDGTP